jgi:NAD+ kinase
MTTGGQRVAVVTHRRAPITTSALRELVAAARQAGATLHFAEEEVGKHRLTPGDGLVLGGPQASDVELCVALGGDGTILTALRHYAGTAVPVFGVNYGEVGFLATIDPSDGLGGAGDLVRAFTGDYDTLALPAISAGRPEATWAALNDISVHRKAGLRVADLSYALAGEEIGRVRCDGIVVSTPQGSTGYNLANGGPVLAWGVKGFVVSFIAPHSLTARALVVAPDDELTIHNASREEPVEVAVDGRPTCELAPGEDLHVEFGRTHALLAQLPGASFYHRLRERFGRLAH